MMPCKCTVISSIGIDEKGCEKHIRHTAIETQKDNSIRPKLCVDRHVAHSLGNQLRVDISFLARKGLMDYSILLGITNASYMLEDDQKFLLPRYVKVMLIL